MPYRRVIPRDLFNESKLLKCLGRVATHIHDGKGERWGLRLEHDTDANPGFTIEQDQDTGDLYCSNLTLYAGEEEIILSSSYNSREPYPLIYTTEEHYYGVVLDDAEGFSREFTDVLDKLKEKVP